MVVDVDLTARAAAIPFIRSARMQASGSISYRLSSVCLSSADPNMPAGRAKIWWCKHRRRLA
jgi:hypothetical protein